MPRTAIHVLRPSLLALLVLSVVAGGADARPGGGAARGRAGGASPARIGGAAQNHAPMSGRPGLAAQAPRVRAGGEGRPGAQQLQGYLNLPVGQLNGQPLAAGQLSARGADLRATAQSWVGNLQNGPQPFSAAWYADHPNAWQYTHPHADAWAVASVATATAWLGWGAVDGGNGGSTTTVYVEQAPAEPTLADAPATPPNAETAPTTPAGDWLPLGVFALSRPEGSGRQVVQLAVNRAGDVQGVYYDEFLGATVNVVGAVDRATQLVSWSPESNRQTVFTVSLVGLTSPEAPVDVTTPAGGETWLAVRLEAPQ